MRSNVALASVALATALAMAPEAARAQYVAPSAPPLFGVVRLSSGFMPDPHIVEGQGGGPVSLSAVDGRCRGYAQQAPSHVLMAASGFRYLAIMVNASFDTTIMVQTPDGQTYCNDDGDGLQARVELSTGPGPIRIWVGSYSSSGGGPYRLGFSELPHIRRDAIGMPGMGGPPPVVGGGPPPGIRPASPPLYGATAVRAGFMPDPAILTGVGGGALRASDIDGSCRGYITAEPTHVVTAQTPFSNLRFVMSADLDTTLLIQYPDGRIVCDDDGGEGLNALIEGPTVPGPIRIWVGSYSSGRTGPYTMGITEYPHITASTLRGGGGGGTVTVAPPPVVTPPPAAATRVELTAGIPVTIFGPLTSATLAVWSPRGGPTVEIGIQPTGGALDVTAGVAGRASTLVTVPGEIARDAVVTVTQRRDGQLILHAERPAGGAGDPGAQMMLLLSWPRRGSAPEIAQQWLGAGGDRAPRWAR